jgi:hypothetical protein
MKKTRFSLQEDFPDDGNTAAEINRKLNLGEANKPCFRKLFVLGEQLTNKRQVLVGGGKNTLNDN